MFIDFLFNEQCDEQFKAFKRGFYKVVSEDLIDLFTPEELELLICGTHHLDFKDLEEAAKYVDGYTREHEVISWLWDIIHNDMSED